MNVSVVVDVIALVGVAALVSWNDVVAATNTARCMAMQSHDTACQLARCGAHEHDR